MAVTNKQLDDRLWGAGITGAFLALGAKHVEKFDSEHTRSRFGGQIGLIAELCSFVPMYERKVREIEKQYDGVYPGVLHYEVTEEFGAWLAEHVVQHDRYPLSAEAEKWVDEGLHAFFKQGREEAHHGRRSG